MSYWKDWARQVAEAEIEQENEAKIYQNIDQTAANVSEQTNVVSFGDYAEIEAEGGLLGGGEVEFDLTNVNDQDIDQDADNDADIDQDNDNDGFVVAANVATDDVTVIL